MILIIIYISLFQSSIELDSTQDADSIKSFSVAFLADVHLHNLFISQEQADGIPLPNLGKTDKKILARTLDAQLRSTRLFNENYFALIQALENLVKEGVKFAVLNGDFTDDGQPINISFIKSILSKYSKEHGLRFFLSPGNHDPGKPVRNPAGKPDFMNHNGQPIGIYSSDHPNCSNIEVNSTSTFCKDYLEEYGYLGIFNQLSEFGFKPLSTDYYFETPFSKQHYNTYSYEESGNKLSERVYIRCRSNLDTESGTRNPAEVCFEIPDLSYLIEPVKDLWLVSIDANVYSPIRFETINGSYYSFSDSTLHPDWFSGSGNAGFNEVIKQKPHIIEWISSINSRAEEHGKTVVFFSHFPTVGFYNGADNLLGSVFGMDSHQLSRYPSLETSKVLAKTGMKLHFGGHMHMNDTGVYSDSEDTFLVNIQVPSIAAYPPAYKIAHFSNQDLVTIETKKLNFVKNFDTLFGLYQSTTATDLSSKSTPSILSATSYWDFTKIHFENLIELRFIPDEWTQEMLAEIELNIKSRELELDSSELIHDFYKLRNGGSLSHFDVAPERLDAYRMVELNSYTQFIESSRGSTILDKLLEIIKYQINIHPDENFGIDMKTGKIRSLN